MIDRFKQKELTTSIIKRYKAFNKMQQINKLKTKTTILICLMMQRLKLKKIKEKNYKKGKNMIRERLLKSKKERESNKCKLKLDRLR